MTDIHLLPPQLQPKRRPLPPGHGDHRGPVRAVRRDLAVALLTGVPPLAPGTVWGVNLMLAGQPVLILAPRQPGCSAHGQTGPKIPA